MEEKNWWDFPLSQRWIGYHVEWKVWNANWERQETYWFTNRCCSICSLLWLLYWTSLTLEVWTCFESLMICDLQRLSGPRFYIRQFLWHFILLEDKVNHPHVLIPERNSSKCQTSMNRMGDFDSVLTDWLTANGMQLILESGLRWACFIRRLNDSTSEKRLNPLWNWFFSSTSTPPFA